MDKIVVTGGLGLIGSHLLEKLAMTQKKVLVIDNMSTGNLRNIDKILESSNIAFIDGSITDSDLVKRSMEGAQICYHLAASLGVKKILSDSIASYKTNVQGTENIVSVASEFGVKVFFASTSEIYGKNSIQPLTEKSDRVLGSPLNIRWAYSEAKALDESLLQMYRQERGLEYVVGRFFNTVGPRQTGEYGMVLPNFVKSALSGDDIEVYGDGEQTRVFLHVRDAVDAVIELMSENQAIGDVFNIGGEGEISIKQLAMRVKEISGSNSKIVHVPYSSVYSEGFEETLRRVPDTNKLRNLTGWRPNYSLNQIIEDVVTFARTVN
jgi:UDP-glucose 4-epimerase